MSRRRKKGIDYFSLDCDFFSDPKIRILKARYGADGIVIYLYLLCEIYKEGYYLKFNDDLQYVMSDELNMSIDKVKQVLKFLLERSLFDNKLFQSDAVLTSAGIQERFQLAVKTRAKKNPIKIEGFWLLSESETEPFLKVAHFEEYSKKNEHYSGKNEHYSEEKSLKESKVNKYIYFKNQELNDVFLDYLSRREEDNLTDAQIKALKTELQRLGQTDEERIAICLKALAAGWKSFYPIKQQKKQASTAMPGRKNQFHNFDQRSYDYADLENIFIQKVNKVDST